MALRRWEPEDAEWYVRARDDVIFRWTTEPRDLTADAVRQAIQAQRRRATYAGFAITDLRTKELFGNISLVLTEPDCDEAEVSFWLAPAARGRGAATDALRTICAWAFECFPIRRIELLTDSDNVASQRVARRAGFTAEGKRGDRLLYAAARRSRRRGTQSV